MSRDFELLTHKKFLTLLTEVRKRNKSFGSWSTEAVQHTRGLINEFGFDLIELSGRIAVGHFRDGERDLSKRRVPWRKNGQKEERVTVAALLIESDDVDDAISLLPCSEKLKRRRPGDPATVPKRARRRLNRHFRV